MVEVADLGFDGSRMLCVPWQVLQPGAELGLLVGVARAAFHFGQLFGMGEFFLGELGVASGAFLVRVRGSFECGGVEWRRDAGLPFAHTDPGFMTAEAIVGAGKRLGLLRREGCGEKSGCYEEAPQDGHSVNHNRN
jgi:hypothetical protein